MTALPATYSPWELLVLPAALYVALAVAVARRQEWPGEIKLAVAGTGVVLVSVWLISFSALTTFARAASIDDPLSALFPVAIDGEMAVGTIVWIAVGTSGVSLADIQTRRDAFRWAISPRPYVALLVGAAAGLSSVANAVHPLTAGIHYSFPAPWSYGASAVPGVAMFAVIHQLVILFRVLRPEPTAPKPRPEAPEPTPLPPVRPSRTPLPVAPKAAVEPEPPAEPNGRRREIPVTLTEARAAYRRLAAKGPFSGAALGRALGVSEVSGRNWKGKVERAEAKGSGRPFRLRGVAA